MPNLATWRCVQCSITLLWADVASSWLAALGQAVSSLSLDLRTVGGQLKYTAGMDVIALLLWVISMVYGDELCMRMYVPHPVHAKGRRVQPGVAVTGCVGWCYGSQRSGRLIET